MFHTLYHKKIYVERASAKEGPARVNIVSKHEFVTFLYLYSEILRLKSPDQGSSVSHVCFPLGSSARLLRTRGKPLFVSTVFFLERVMARTRDGR